MNGRSRWGGGRVTAQAVVAALALLGSSAQAYTFTCAKVYASATVTGGSKNVYELNGAVMTSIFTAPQIVDGIAVSANGSAYYDNAVSPTFDLLRYNGTTQTATGQTLTALNVGEAADAVGNVFYIDSAYHLRKAAFGGTGAASDLGALIFDAGDTIGPTLTAGDLTFDGNGRLHWYSSVGGGGASYLYIIDPATLKTKSLGNIGPVAATGLAFDAGGKLITTVAGGATVISIDLGAASLAGVTLGTANPKVLDLGSCAAPNLNAALALTKTAANITKATNPATVAAPGDTIEYTITATNSGNLPATDALLTDSIPAGSSYVAGSTTLNGGAVADVSGVMPYVAGKEIFSKNQPSGVVTAGAVNAAVVKFRVTVNASGAPYSVDNTASLSYPTVSGGVTTSNPLSATARTPISPRLTLSKTVAAPGRQNTADQFTVQIKAGAAVTAGVSTTGATTGSASTVSTATTLLTAGTVYTLTEVMAAGSVSGLGLYTTAISCSNANAASPTVLPSGAGQSFSLTPVAGDLISCTFTNTPINADLIVTKAASKPSYAAGEDVIYTVALNNAGPNAANNAVLSDTLPGQIIAVSWTCLASGGAVCPATSGSGNLAQTVATLPSGGSVTYTITGLARTSGTGILNTASVAMPAGVLDPNTGNNSASASIAITNPPPGSMTSPGLLTPYTTCLDFNGMPNLAPGGSWTKTITSADGVALTYTVAVTGVSVAGTTGTPAAGDGLEAYTPGTWQGDRWQLYFGANLKNALSNNPTGRDVQYTVSAYALIGALSVPLQLVTGSAEEDGANGDPARPLEYVQSTTNGTSFGLADIVTTGGPFRRVTVSGGGKTIRTTASSLDAAGGNTQINIALFSTQKRATAANPLVLTSRMLGSGKTAQGFCAEFYPDRGDAPASYGGAAHYTDTTYSPLLADGTYLYDQLTVGARTDSTTLWLGAAKPSVESAPRGSNGLGDSDDAVSSFPPLTSANTRYSLDLTCRNTTAVPATIAGWFDFNANGSFDTAERASASCPVGGGTFTLSWTGLSNIPVGITYARLRMSTDVPSTNAATGAAPDGEVEDFAITVVTGADLQVTKVGPAYARPGETLTYTITVTNLNGSAPVTTTVTDTLPSGLTYQSSTPAASVSAQTLSWTISNLASGASQSYTVTATAPSAATLSSTPAVRTQTNAVSVSSTLTDPFTADNAASATTRFVQARLVKQVRNVTQGGSFGTTGGGKPNDTLEYCIDFHNEGGVDLPSFVIDDPVPANTTALSSGYGADGSGAGLGLQLTRSSAVSNLTSTATDTDKGSLSSAMRVTLGTLNVGESGSVCFRATIR